MGLPYRGPTERAQFKIDSFGYILYFLCKCSRATYDFNFGVTPSHQQRVVGENSLLFCSGAANWIFAQLQIASLMKACHCQAGPEWVNVINFLFCDPRPRRSPKMWNSLCFGKSYLGLMQQEQVADMERRFCIRLDAKLTLIKLPLDADALVVILQTHKDTRRQKMQNVAFWFRLDSSWFWHGWEQVVWRPSWKAAFAIPTHNFAIFANFAIPTHNWQETHTWKSLVSNVSNILRSSSPPPPSLPSLPSLSPWPQRSVL